MKMLIIDIQPTIQMYMNVVKTEFQFLINMFA